MDGKGLLPILQARRLTFLDSDSDSPLSASPRCERNACPGVCTMPTILFSDGPRHTTCGMGPSGTSASWAGIEEEGRTQSEQASEQASKLRRGPVLDGAPAETPDRECAASQLRSSGDLFGASNIAGRRFDESEDSSARIPTWKERPSGRAAGQAADWIAAGQHTTTPIKLMMLSKYSVPFSDCLPPSHAAGPAFGHNSQKKFPWRRVKLRHGAPGGHENESEIETVGATTSVCAQSEYVAGRSSALGSAPVMASLSPTVASFLSIHK